MEDDLDSSLFTRTQVSWYNHLGDFLNMLKAFIGTNYQALPFAFHNSGLLLGIIGVFVIASLTDYCIQLLVKCKFYIIEDVSEEERASGTSEHDILTLRRRLERTMGYGDIAKRAFGNWCYTLTQFLVWFTQFATLISYFVFIGNTVFEIFPLVPMQILINNSTPVNDSLVEREESRMGMGVPMLALEHIHRIRRDLDSSFSMHDDASVFHMSQGYRNHSDSVNVWYPLPGVKNISLTTEAPIVDINSSTLAPVTNISTTLTPNITMSTVLPTSFTWVTTAPNLRLIMLFPLPFFILTSLVRRVRVLAPFSSFAALALTVGAASVMAYLLVGFEVVETYSLAKLSTLPLFLGQIISAYEGIGCIMPIHCSMEGNRHLFPAFLHANVYVVFLILACFGSFGYLRYGEDVQQIIVMNIPQHSILSIFVDVTLILSVLFTYPLQCFPVIEIVESYIFGTGRCCGKHEEPRLEYDEIDTSGPIQTDSRGLLPDYDSVELHASQVSVVIPPEVAAWKRNIVRVVITLCVAAASIALRDAYAYLNVVSGAVGCSALSLILPCMIHLKLRQQDWHHKLIDGAIIVFAVVASVLALVEIVMRLAKGGVSV